MIKRLIFLLTIFATPLFAQQQSPTVSGSIVASSTSCATSFSCVWESVLPNNAATTTINLSGTFSATLLVEESNNGGQTWSTAATLSTAGTTTYSTNGFTDIRVRCSAYTSGTATVTISTGLNTGLQGPPGPAGSGGGSTTFVASLPAICTPGVTNNVSLNVAPFQTYQCIAPNVWSPDFPGVVNATAYGASPAKFFVAACSFTTGSPSTVTCPASSFASSDTGGICFGTNWNGADSNYPAGSASSVTLTQGTFTFTNSTTGSCSGTGSLGSSQTFVVGPDSTTALNAAYTAASTGPVCLAIQMPSFAVLVQAAIGMAAATCAAGPTTINEHQISWTGWQSEGSWIIPTPNFSFTNCGSSGCFFGSAGTGGIGVSDITIWGAGNNLFGQTPGVTVIVAALDGAYRNVGILGWGAHVGLNGMTGFSFGQARIVSTLMIDGVGYNACGANNSFATNVIAVSCVWSANTPLVISGGEFVCSGCFFQTNTATQDILQTGGNATLYNPQFSNATGSVQTTNVFLQNASRMDIYSMYPTTNTITTNSDVFILQNTSILHLKNARTLQGGATGAVFSAAAGTTVFDDGGNSYSGTVFTGAGAIIGHQYSQNCTSSASPAVCGSAAAGVFTLPAAATSVTVNTTAVTANSIVIVFNDDSLGTRLGVTCNTGLDNVLVSARVPGTSFTITGSAPVTNPNCYSYIIVN